MDVIVIGCGASGTAALRRLYEAGLNAIGLEAADRIGGRVHSVAFGAAAVDLGGAWCEGKKNNKVFELADPFDLLEKEKPMNTLFLLSNGDLMPDDLCNEIVTRLNDVVNEADKNCTKSISECVRNATETKSSLTKLLVEWYERANHVGGLNDPLEGKSLKGLQECAVERAEMMNWKGRGYKTILDILLNKYPDPEKELPIEILLNKEVESIKWGPNKPGLEAEHPLVHVKCKDGSLYAAKSVIITVSIGVLKERHQQLFNPPLPNEKVNAINNFQSCVLGKIYIEFTKPWWPKTPASFSILWQEEDKAKISDKDKWITEVYGMETVAYQPNVLLAWLYGNGALQMERVSEEDVKTGVEKIFDLIFKRFEVAPIKSIIRTQWGSNPLTRGAYAYRSVAVEEKGGTAEILSEPLYHGDAFPIVCFGGEATSHKYHTAVHGAVEAGFREADRIIQHIKQ